MRNPLRHRLLRDLKGDFGKYLAIFMLLVVSIAFVSGFIVADSSMIKAYNESFENYNIENGHFLVADELTDKQKEAIEEKGISIFRLFYVEKEMDNDTTMRIFTNRVDVNRACVMEGKLAEKAGEIAIDRMYADNNDLKIGDHLSDGSTDFEIVGLLAFSDYSTLFYDNNDMMFDAQQFGVAAISDDISVVYPNDAIKFCYSWKYDEEPEDEITEKEVSENLMEYISQIAELDDFIPRYLNQAITFTGEDMGSDKAMMEVLLYIIIIISAFVFAIPTNDTIQKEANVIGTLRAMGYTRQELIRHYMLMPLIVTLIAALVGNILGYTVLKQVCADMYYGSYSLPTYVTIWSAEAFFKTTLIPGALMMLITYVILRQKLSLSPLQFLRRDLTKNRNKKAVQLSPAITFFNRFRLRIILQNMSNYVMLFVGLIFANVLLFFGMMLPPLLTHFQETIKDNMLANYIYMIRIPQSALDSEDMLGAMVDMNMLMVNINTNNEDAEKFSAYSFKTPDTGSIKQESIVVYGCQEDSKYIHASFDDKTVLISTSYADKYNLSSGDVITLKEPYEEKYYGFKVTGVYDYEGAVCVFMSQKHLNDVLGFNEDFFSGYFSDTEIADIGAKYIGSVVDEDALTKVSRQLKISKGEMMKLVDAFAIGLFMVLVYVLSKIIIEKNTQSISMAKILGYSNKEISKLYITPTNILVVLFLLISYPLVAVFLVQIFKVMLRQMMSGWLTIYLEPMVYLEMFLLAIGTYIVVAIIEYRKIQKVPMEEALKNVE